MGLFRILPLMFMVARVFTTRIPLCVLPPDQARFPTESTENCLCSGGSQTIINSLDPDNTGVERLVIYIYRKLTTGEIIAFIPHRQLQQQIPDFPEKYGSVHELNDHASIINIFDISPSKEIRKTDEPEKSYLPGQIYVPHPGRPSGKEPKQIIIDDKRYIHGRPQNHPNEDPNHPSWLIPLDNTYPRHTPESNDHKPIDYSQYHIEPYKYRPDHSHSEHNPIYVTPKGSNEETYPHEDTGSVQPWIYDTAPNPYSNIADEESEEDYLEHPTSDENGSVKDSSEPSNPHIQIIPLNPKRYHHISNDYSKLDEYERDAITPSNRVPNVKIIRVPRKDSHGRIIGWQIIKNYLENKSHHNIYNDGHQGKVPSWRDNSNPNWVRHRVINGNPADYYHDKFGDHEHAPSFDYWLEHQLNNTTINRNQLPTSDLIALHTAIRNTLLQNGLIVTKHGTLMDGHGMVSSLNNLKLRPILMGKSISFDHFMRNSHSDINFTIPPNSPTIEGLLLTMITPPKILGIVPLSKSAVSPHQKHHDEVPIHRPELHKVDKRTSLKVLPISQLVSFRKDSPILQKLSKAKDPSVTKTSSNDQSEKPDPVKQGLKEKSVEGDSGKHAEGLSEEVPDFRIIGGMSATVSGTPILNRGRSGYEFEYLDEYGPSPTEPASSHGHSQYGQNDHSSPIQLSSRYGRNYDARDKGTHS